MRRMRARLTFRSTPLNSTLSGNGSVRKRAKRTARRRQPRRLPKRPSKAALTDGAAKRGLTSFGRKRSLQVQHRSKRRTGRVDVPPRGDRFRGPYQIRALRALWRAAEVELAHRAPARGVHKGTDSADRRSSGTDLGLVDWTLDQVQDLQRAQVAMISQSGEVSRRLPDVVGAIAEIFSSPAVAVVTPASPTSSQADTASASVSTQSGSVERSPITSTNLQSAITEAVKKSVPGCEAFVGVIVQQTTPKSRFDSNWALRGVKFGRADRDRANEAVRTIVKRMQREFHISDE
jgi:hypothetical protein